ncbi:cytochrome P450 71B10-like [Papaver somniferum]|uniref:cytochrome P450 71B10-like n=1 Tax=Papaver somniferum TaxID=3469 RepID=UPI000E6F921B|nr:cytochrome P450 71B10-like [Papaver somniferum]
MEFLVYIFYLILVPLILLLPLYVLIMFKRSKDGDQLPPSPPKLPIIGNLHQLREPPHQELRKLSQKYGPVMLLQLGSVPTLVISSAEAAKQVLKTHDLDFCTRPPLACFKRISHNYLDIACSPFGEYWREIRKICVLELLSMKRVQSFKVIREEEVAEMIHSISSTANSTAPIDVFECLSSFTNRTICRVAFGSKLNQGIDQFDEGILRETMDEITNLISAFWFSDIFPKVGWIVDRISGIHGRFEKCCKNLDTYIQDVIEKHLNPERLRSEYDDLIDVLLKLQKDGTSTIRHTNEHIKAILMDVFVAGVDTVAVTMNWTMAELIKNPATMHKVQEEIRSHVGKNKGKQVQENDLLHFQYLKLVVKETLRLHPPLPLSFPRECMRKNKIDGYDVKPKTRVLINVWAIGRSPMYWDKPDKFYPDRFIDKPVEFGGQKDFSFLPFGGGRRGCPGIDMGMVTVELALANLLHNFDWKLPSGMKTEDLNMDEVSGIVTHKKDPLHLVPIQSKNF